LALLYEAETRPLDPLEVLAGLPLPPEPYAAELVRGVAARAGEIDALVGGHSTGWAIERMPALDRGILRIATCELLDHPEVPLAVVIDEAVELAKAYSTEDSSRFVNGVLSAIATGVRAEEVAATPDGARPDGDSAREIVDQ
jgi:transcription antitermination protein NusB